MKHISSILILFFLLMSPALVCSQDSQADTLETAADPEMDLEEELEEIIEEPEEPEPEVLPLIRPEPTGFHKALTDSMLRWQQWMNSDEWYHNRQGVITHRMGMFGRNDAVYIRGRQEHHRRASWEGIPMNDRITGSLNANRLPWYRISAVYEQDNSAMYHSEYRLRDYYVNKPLTWINAELAPENYRNTEVMVTRNFGRNTNLEASWWDKQSNPGYPRNMLEGNQFNLKAYHHLTDQIMLRGGVMRNTLDLQEPNGYQIADMSTFQFLFDSTLPIQNNARSELNEWLMYSSLFYRQHPDEESLSRVNLYMNSNERRYFSADTLDRKYRTAGVNAEHQLHFSIFETALQSGFEHTHLPAADNSNREINQWQTLYAHPRAELYISDFFTAGGSFYGAYRTGNTRLSSTDPATDITFYAGINLFDVLNIKATQSLASLPLSVFLLQEIANNEDAIQPDNERINRQEISAVTTPLPYIKLSGTAWHSLIRDGHVYTGDGQLSAQDYTSIGADVGLAFDVPRFEGDFSVTFQQTDFIYSQQDRMWLRGSLYYKNYIYDRAAFMKAGIKGTLSPFAYRTPAYFPAADIWGYLPLDDSAGIPGFQRVDLDFSIRLRSAVFLLQFENLLGAFNMFPVSYFETADYPMYPYRFRFGVRWLLRN